MYDIDAASSLSNKASIKDPCSPSSFNLSPAKYTDKVINQINMGDFHGFPESVKAFEEVGNVTWKNSGDGIFRKWIQIPGGYKGKDGLFEFLIEPNGTINHRIFTPNKY